MSLEATKLRTYEKLVWRGESKGIALGASRFGSARRKTRARECVQSHLQMCGCGDARSSNSKHVGAEQALAAVNNDKGFEVGADGLVNCYRESENDWQA